MSAGDVLRLMRFAERWVKAGAALKHKAPWTDLHVITSPKTGQRFCFFIA